MPTFEDPALEWIAGSPDLDKILGLYTRVTGDPALDPEDIANRVAALRTTPDVDTGHPFLDLSVKVGLASIDATFEGDHPKYGVGEYAKPIHDSFPPTLIAAVDALSAWGLHTRAAQLFRYWLRTFVRGDGTIDYYGPAISEYGQLLHTACLLVERGGGDSLQSQEVTSLRRVASYLVDCQSEAIAKGCLISGSPEADTRHDTGQYFHNNAWVVRGLRQWAALCDRLAIAPADHIAIVRTSARVLAQETLRSIQQTWPADLEDWWLPPQVEPVERPDTLTATEKASYTNYRYWPELLSSGLLTAGMAHRLVAARLAGGGQFCGMTRFVGHLDDWPLADYLYGLWALGRRRDFLLSLYGHAAYHQAEGHLTAYEQVTLPPGRAQADYCLPCQLVVARAARLLVR
jgi:hypothetical protein